MSGGVYLKRGDGLLKTASSRPLLRRRAAITQSVIAAVAVVSLVMAAPTAARQSTDISAVVAQSYVFADLPWTCTVHSQASLNGWFRGDTRFSSAATVCQLHHLADELFPAPEMTSGYTSHLTFRDVSYFLVMSSADARVYWNFPGSWGGTEAFLLTDKKPLWKVMPWPPTGAVPSQASVKTADYVHPPIRRIRFSHRLPSASTASIELREGQGVTFPTGVSCSAVVQLKGTRNAFNAVHCSGFRPPGRTSCNYAFSVTQVKGRHPLAGPTAAGSWKTEPNGTLVDIGGMFVGIDNTGTTGPSRGINGGYIDNSRWRCP